MPQPAKGEIVPFKGGAFTVRCFVGRGRERGLFSLAGCATRAGADVLGAEVARAGRGEVELAPASASGPTFRKISKRWAFLIRRPAEAYTQPGESGREGT